MRQGYGLLLMYTLGVATVILLFNNQKKGITESDPVRIGTMKLMGQHKQVFDQVSNQTREQYKDALRRYAGGDKLIILAAVDEGYVDMAINLYETSFLKNHLRHFLFVSFSHHACDELDRFDIPCFTYVHFLPGNRDSAYLSQAFLKKMELRTQFLKDALSFGYTVLHTDTDIIFLRNPFTGFRCGACDLEVMGDGQQILNAGFVYLHPTQATIELYKKMAYTLNTNPKEDDQLLLNSIVRKEGNINFNILDSSKYVCGKYYFEYDHRYFGGIAKPCPECIVVHNNWIVSKAAKIYRFKEMSMWMYDGGGYYSDTSRKYLTYNNPLIFPPSESFFVHEKNALRSALAIGRILNRTVILPRFHSGDTYVPLNYHVTISLLDKNFKDKYRESTFLTHPKVPQNILFGETEAMYIKSDLPSYRMDDIVNIPIFVPAETKSGATSSEIRSWFEELDGVPVLRFHSLYGAFSKFDDKRENVLFNSMISQSLKRGEYRQYAGDRRPMPF